MVENGMVSVVTQYEAPEILENGDIIIRRKTPRGQERKAVKGDLGMVKARRMENPY